MKLKLLILFHSLFVFYCHAQLDSKNFRFPPEVYLKSKISEVVDLSFKVEKRSKPQNYENIKNTYHTKYDLSNLDKYKNDIKTYNYLKEVSAFFNSIKPQYQNMYTKMELWYIYIYDIDLSRKLTQ